MMRLLIIGAVALILSGCVGLGYHEAKVQDVEDLLSQCQQDKLQAWRECDDCRFLKRGEKP